MPRKNSRRIEDIEPARRPGGGLGERRERWRGEDYLVRALAASDAARFYRCPGCDQQIPAAQPHVVAWPAHDAEADDRRHWHTPCWVNRDRRAPRPLRGRSAPRY
jgi:hypothetical protein